jgi:hypothetical protein
MQDQVARVQAQDQIFSPAFQAFDATACYPASQVGRDWPAQAAFPDCGAGKTLADQVRNKASAYRFNFR